MEPTNRHWPRLLGIACIVFSAPGCANFWEEALSSERDWAYISGMGKPHPLVVLRDNADRMPNADGLRRAEALGGLNEPIKNGGNAHEQETYLNILGLAAKTDHEPACRLSAVRTLGRYQDARAARLLEEVYQLPIRIPGKPDNGQVLFFTADLNSTIRREALVALEATRDLEARHLLIRVARQPGPPVTADLVDRQQTQDEKIVAIRALRKYPQPECVDALKFVLKTEKDVALRDRALQSLEETTGKKWPAQYEAWQRDTVQPVPGENAGFIQQVGGWFSR